MVPAENLLVPFDFILSWTNPSTADSSWLQVFSEIVPDHT